VKGLKELYLNNNRLGPFFLRCMMEALKLDDYVRVMDLRDNKFGKKMIKDETIDLIGSLRRNESITNIDFRGNDCFDK